MSFEKGVASRLVDEFGYLTEKLINKIDMDIDELQKRLNEAFKNDKSHTKRLSEN